MRGERMLPLMPYNYFRHMSDGDARSVVAFLRTLPPAEPCPQPLAADTSSGGCGGCGDLEEATALLAELEAWMPARY